MFGEGVAHGPFLSTMVMGANVRITWLGPAQDPKPPPSRSAENLKRAPGGRMRTTSFTAGTDFESGAAHRSQGVNDAEAQ